MGAGYEVWVCNDYGWRLGLLDAALMRLEYVKSLEKAGYFSIQFGKALDTELLQVDRFIEIFRRPVGGSLSMDFLGFLRYWEREFSKDVYSLTLAGPDQNDILARRIVAYAAGTAQAGITGAADDGVKDVFNENFLSGATDADRRLDHNFMDITVQGDASAGASVDKGFAWRDVPRVMKDVADAAETAGERVYYWLAALGINENGSVPVMQFQTATGQPGNDLTNVVIFSPEWGNVEKASLAVDYREEVNYVYAGGQGEGSERVIQTASDTGRINASIYNRREAFVDARNEADPDRVQDVADAALAAGRPVRTFEATLLDTSQARYGLDWNLGDKVTVRAFGEQFAGIVRTVKVKVSRGEESIDVKVVEA